MGIPGRMFDGLVIACWDMMQKDFISLAGHEMSSIGIFERDDRVAMLGIWVMWFTKWQLQSR